MKGVFKWLRNDANQHNAIGDYSGVGNEEAFYYECTQQPMDLERMVVTIRDGSGNIDGEKYGNNITLSVGIIIRIVRADGVTIDDLTDGVPIMSNIDWGSECFDVNLKNWGGVSDHKFVLIRWTVGKKGSPVRLYPGDRFEVLLNDAFGDLVGHKFKINGDKVIDFSLKEAT